MNKSTTKTPQEILAERDAVRRNAELDLWLHYRDANPFERARLRKQHGATIERGRALDPDEKSPPDAA